MVLARSDDTGAVPARGHAARRVALDSDPVPEHRGGATLLVAGGETLPVSATSEERTRRGNYFF